MRPFNSEAQIYTSCTRNFKEPNPSLINNVIYNVVFLALKCFILKIPKFFPAVEMRESF